MLRRWAIPLAWAGAIIGGAGVGTLYGPGLAALGAVVGILVGLVVVIVLGAARGAGAEDEQRGWK